MKLFGKNGKMNVVDIVLLAVLAAVILCIALYFILGREPADLGGGDVSEEPNLRFVVLFEKLPAELGENLIDALEGDAVEVAGSLVEPNRLFNGSLLTDAFVIDAGMTTNEDNSVNVTFTIKAAAEYSKGIYITGTQEIRVGAGYSVKTLTCVQTGTIIAVEELHD